MPQELPGLYYDEEKKRYFPLKGPIPGSRKRRKSPPPSPSSLSPTPTSVCNNKRKSISSSSGVSLLQVRELCGNIISSRHTNGRFSFMFEYHKALASAPLIFKYHGTEKLANRALQHLHLDDDDDVTGTSSSDALLAAGFRGTLCLFQVGRVSPEFSHWENLAPDQVWPSHVSPIHFPRHLRRNVSGTLLFPSDVTCIKTLPKHAVSAADASSNHFLITTLGCEASRGSVYHLHFTEPIDYSRGPLAWRNIDEITSFNRTIWTADCNSDGSRAVIGTNGGTFMVNIETGVQSTICRCESDVLSLQTDQPGNFVLCGLRNGAILTLDAREKPEDYSARLTRHRILYPSSKPSSKRTGIFTKAWFELKGNLYPEHTIFMHSSISCLALLKLYDQYFCASSMDGSIKLYDRRLVQRGAVQSYEGNVNSHTRIHFGVDPAERMVMSGGEDGYLRAWSIKTGELLFENKLINSAPSIVCWPGTKELQGERQDYSGAWVGSEDGLFHVKWSWDQV